MATTTATTTTRTAATASATRTAAAIAAGATAITAAPMVAYTAPTRPNSPVPMAWVPCPTTVPQGATIAWCSNHAANLYPRFNAMPQGGKVALGPVACSAKRCHGALAPALAKAFANGPVLFGAIANLPVLGHGTLGQHLTFLTGHGHMVLA
jgi:hypothetical protein